MNTMQKTALSRFVAAATLGLALAGCASNGASQSSSAMDIFNSYKSAWNRHDHAAIAAAFGQSGKFSTPEFGGQPQGAEGIAGYTQALFVAVPDFKVQVTRVRSIGDGALAEEWVATGTWSQPFPGGPLAGKPASGKSFVLPGSGFVEIRDGKIVRATHYFDQLAFLTQIGAIGQ